MFRTLAVVGVILIAIIVVNYRAPDDPVKQIDPAPLARQVAAVAPFPVLMPTDPGWRPTATRWDQTQESDAALVWYVGGVYGPDGPFASLTQSVADSPEYLREQTRDGKPAGAVPGAAWQRFESASGDRSLVLAADGQTTIVAGTGSWEDLQRFAGSLVPVSVN